MTTTSPNQSSSRSNTPNPSLHPETKQKSHAPPFDWYETWYPIMLEENLQDKIHRFFIWDSPYAIYRNTKDGSYVVMDDVCPHRLAPLSEGRLVSTTDPSTGEQSTSIECGYHGWTFSCTGSCLNIPNGPENVSPPAAAKVRTYPTVVSLGRIYMWTGKGNPTPPEGPVPKFILEAEKEDKLCIVRSVDRSFPFSYQTLIENLIDPAHVPWSHHNVQGNRDRVKKGSVLKIVYEDLLGGSFDAKGPSSLESAYAETSVSFKAPGFVNYAIRFSNTDLIIGLIFAAIPTGRYTCLLTSHNYTINPKPIMRIMSKILPKWIAHNTGNLILDGDAVLIQRQELFIESCTEDSTRVWKKYTPTAWDSLVLAYRRWRERVAYSEPYLAEIGSPASYAQLLRTSINDRYEHHVKKCTSCSGALKNARMIRLVAYIMLSIAGAAGLFSAIIAGALINRTLGYNQGVLKGVIIGAVLIGIVMLAVIRLTTFVISLMTYTELAYKKSKRNVVVE